MSQNHPANKTIEKIPINLNESFEIVDRLMRIIGINDHEVIIRGIKESIDQGLPNFYLVNHAVCLISEALENWSFSDENGNRCSLSSFFSLFHESQGRKLQEIEPVTAWKLKTPNLTWPNRLVTLLNTQKPQTKEEWCECLFTASCIFIEYLGGLYKTNDSLLKEFDPTLRSKPDTPDSDKSVISNIRHSLAHSNLIDEGDGSIIFFNRKANISITMTKQDFVDRVYIVSKTILEEPYAHALSDQIKKLAADLNSLHGEAKRPLSPEMMLKCIELLIGAIHESLSEGFDDFTTCAINQQSSDIARRFLHFDTVKARNKVSHMENIIHNRQPDTSDPEETSAFKSSVEILLKQYNAIRIMYELPQVSLCLWHIKSSMAEHSSKLLFGTDFWNLRS